MSTKSCLIIAGEKSGEEHCLSFFNGLKQQCPEVDFFGVGGDELESEGMKLIYHLKDFSSWGYSEVFKKIPFYLNATDEIVSEVKARNCKTAILVDFQTFNMRLAKKLKNEGIKVLYVVAPQAWAWKSWRVKTLRQIVDKLYTIIPFEKEWFKQRGVKQTISIDHPVYTQYMDELKTFNRSSATALLTKKKIKLLLLPGSRNFEVRNLLPIFKKVINQLCLKHTIEVSIVKSPSVKKEVYDSVGIDTAKEYQNTEVTEAIKDADLCLAASGTVTLTCGLFELPTIVCYKTSLLNQWIFESFVKYDGAISLNNIIHQDFLFPEFVQDDLEPYALIQKLNHWIEDSDEYLNLIGKLENTKKIVQGECADLATHFADEIGTNK
jgi:lipid-A-disaccharide synthase